ncbi:hypothetical protein, partial [Thermoflexus sp.]|uniref:hypothetical protein n=1 Tax=Thermoflexus sp. TaxID=1969742 RepID=UPI002ADD5F30
MSYIINRSRIHAWVHNIEKTKLSKEDVPEDLRECTKAADPSSVHITKDPLWLWVLAQCHGIAH